MATTSSVINEQQKELNHLKTLCTSLHRVSYNKYILLKYLSNIYMHILTLVFDSTIGFRKELCSSKVTFTGKSSL